jgi:hypothetical protein
VLATQAHFHTQVGAAAAVFVSCAFVQPCSVRKSGDRHIAVADCIGSGGFESHMKRGETAQACPNLSLLSQTRFKVD